MPKAFRCEECGETFDTPQALGPHRRFKHGASKPKAAAEKSEAAVEKPAARARAASRSSDPKGVGIVASLLEAAKEFRDQASAAIRKATRLEEVAAELRSF